MTGAGVCTRESLQFYFYPEENILFDEGGYPVLNPLQYIPKMAWNSFKSSRNYLCVETKEGYFLEFFYVENEQL